MTIFARLAVLDLALEKMTHELHAIANPEHRNPELENRRVRVRRLLRVDALRATREDDPGDVLLAQLRRRRREMIDLRVDLTLADPARDDLGELRAEVEDGDGLWHEQ